MNSALPVPKYHQIYLVLREQLQEGRFAQGLPEAPEPVTTGNRVADELVVEPHDLGGYDDNGQ